MTLTNGVATSVNAALDPTRTGVYTANPTDAANEPVVA